MTRSKTISIEDCSFLSDGGVAGRILKKNKKTVPIET